MLTLYLLFILFNNKISKINKKRCPLNSILYQFKSIEIKKIHDCSN